MSGVVGSPLMDARRWHQWCRAVLSHPGLTPGQKNVLRALAEFADYPQGTNAHPGVEVLAQACCCGVRVVKYALVRGRRLGLIEQTAPANVKRGRAAVYRLLPALVTTCTSVHLVEANQVHESTRTGARNDTTKCTSVPPTDSLPAHDRGSAREGEAPPTPDPHQPGDDPAKQSANRQTSAAPAGAPPRPDPRFVAAPPVTGAPGKRELEPDPEPSQFCDRHPESTNDPCRACGQARETHEAWKARQSSRRRALAEVRAADTAACAECDEEGWLVRPHGLAEDLPDDGLEVRCPHAALWCAYWQPVWESA